MTERAWQYEYNAVFAGRNWNNGETVGKLVHFSKAFLIT